MRIIKPGKTEFKMICNNCDCEFVYELEDILFNRVKCPSCGESLHHTNREGNHKLNSGITSEDIQYVNYENYQFSPLSPPVTITSKEVPPIGSDKISSDSYSIDYLHHSSITKTDTCPCVNASFDGYCYTNDCPKKIKGK